MALIVEDGSIVTGAESYCTVAFADSRLGSRGFSIWTDLLMTEKEQALRRATDYMLQTYRQTWAGERVTSLQFLDWPRVSVTVDGFAVSSQIVPLDIQNACAEMAFRAAAGDLDDDLTQGVKSEKVGPLEVVYDENSSRAVNYRAVDKLLAPYLNTGGGAYLHKVVRA